VWAESQDNDQIEADARGWSPTELLRPEKFSVLASELSN